jgi:hypothetical protein
VLTPVRVLTEMGVPAATTYFLGSGGFAGGGGAAGGCAVGVVDSGCCDGALAFCWGWGAAAGWLAGASVGEAARGASLTPVFSGLEPHAASAIIAPSEMRDNFTDFIVISGTAELLYNFDVRQ